MVAEQFAWNFPVPGKDGKFARRTPLRSVATIRSASTRGPGGKDDLVTVNNLHIPVHRPVIVDSPARTFDPQLQRSGAAGEAGHHPRPADPSVEATQPGHFELACAQLCASPLQHARDC